MGNDEIKLQIGELFFTWDERKRQINVEKHNGITFETAAEALCDPNIIYSAPYTMKGETRWDAIGRLAERQAVLFVVVTERINFGGQDLIRIISARRATQDEEASYYE